MPRTAIPTDAFNAIAAPRRREIIEVLGGRGAQPVGALVRSLRIPQPAVSKHLRILRRAGLVSVRKHGQQRVYQLNATELKPVHDWTKTFERFWDDQLQRIKDRAEQMEQAKRK